MHPWTSLTQGGSLVLLYLTNNAECGEGKNMGEIFDGTKPGFLLTGARWTTGDDLRFGLPDGNAFGHVIISGFLSRHGYVTIIRTT